MASLPACIILAAGQSSRFGANKLCYVLPNGASIARQTVTQYLQVFEQVTVVIKPQGDELRAGLSDLSCRFIECDNAEDGMSQSLIAGIQAKSNAPGWLIALADMPYVQTHTIKSLLEPFDRKRIIQPQYQNQAGNPVIFGRAFYAELLGLAGDKGAKRVVEAHQQHLIKINTEDAGVLQDIDTPADILSSKIG